jgi:hypothetical protein
VVATPPNVLKRTVEVYDLDAGSSATRARKLAIAERTMQERIEQAHYRIASLIQRPQREAGLPSVAVSKRCSVACDPRERVLQSAPNQYISSTLS